MIVFALKPGHDGSIAVLRDNELVLSLESEKDSSRRYSRLQPTTMLEVAEHVGALPDVVALGGWTEPGYLGDRRIGAGYRGPNGKNVERREFFGKQVDHFTSTHERSHIMMAVGMAPPDDAELRTVLVWEGVTGSFYLLDRHHRVVRTVEVMSEPGNRYAFLYALAHPSFPDENAIPAHDYAGKLMALAAFADPRDAGPEIRETVQRILTTPTFYPADKGAFRDSPVHNSGVESEATKQAAALLSQRMFDEFAEAALAHLPAGTPLLVSGGCGLNCDWNAAWRALGHFESVFVPPCTNDSGSAIGTAIDALVHFGGDPHISWSVYSGLDFVEDVAPDPARWRETTLDTDELSAALGAGAVVAWVQGRWEIGPRALGHRSLLAEPFHPSTREKLNRIKQRETYRPIAPVCRIEDTASILDSDFADPFMLYFRRVTRPDLHAVTHVDGSARAQTTSAAENPRLHAVLSSFARDHGVGALCNTSLNFNGYGFINRMSDLVGYCDARGIDDMVVGERRFRRR